MTSRRLAPPASAAGGNSLIEGFAREALRIGFALTRAYTSQSAPR